MRILQSRHQRAATAVDHGRAVGIDQVRRYASDQVVLDEHIGVLDALLVDPVKDVDIGEKRLSGFILSKSERSGCREQNSKGDILDDVLNRTWPAISTSSLLTAGTDSHRRRLATFVGGLELQQDHQK